jgi:serine/threonine-protein kinase
VWAFGAVLYEMLSGQRAFKGDDVSDTLAAVLRQDIDWNALPASTPVSVRRLMARCLDRDVRRRLRDIGEARIVMDDPAALAIGNTGDVPTLAPPPPARPRWRRAIPVLLSAIVTGALAGTAAWHLKPLTPLRVTRFHFTPPDGQPFTGLARRMIDISPDGAQVVYTANGRLYLRSMSDQDAKAIAGTEIHQAVTNPVFSPDGRSVAFHLRSDNQEDCRHRRGGRHSVRSRDAVRHELGAQRHRLLAGKPGHLARLRGWRHTTERARHSQGR